MVSYCICLLTKFNIFNPSQTLHQKKHNFVILFDIYLNCLTEETDTPGKVSRDGAARIQGQRILLDAAISRHFISHFTHSPLPAFIMLNPDH